MIKMGKDGTGHPDPDYDSRKDILASRNRNIENELIKYKTALALALNYINRIAGPIGAGYDIGSFQHFAQATRDEINTLLGGDK